MIVQAGRARAIGTIDLAILQEGRGNRHFGPSLRALQNERDSDQRCPKLAMSLVELKTQVERIRPNQQLRLTGECRAIRSGEDGGQGAAAAVLFVGKQV